MNIQLMHGDCLDLMGSIPDGSVDMILCDLPYGTTACKWDTVIPFEPLWAQYRRVTKPNAAIVLTASQPFTTQLIASNIGEFRYNWVWEKPQGVDPFMAKHRPLNNIEDIVVFSRKKPVYNPQMEPGDPYSVTRDKTPRMKETNGATMRETTTVNSGVRLPKRIIRCNQQKGLHPTQKPVALMEYLIRTYTNEGETVLDNCAGSFTTGVACLNTGRNFIGIERDDHYFKIGSERMAKRAAELEAVTKEDVWTGTRPLSS